MEVLLFGEAPAATILSVASSTCSPGYTDLGDKNEMNFTRKLLERDPGRSTTNYSKSRGVLVRE